MTETLSEHRRQELADFLRSRRDGLRPEEVELPPGRRRRVPGLRREEVALRAGVSTEWYKRLEQARDVRASAETLDRIADALLLEPGERRHLLRLGGYPARTPEGRGREEGVGDHIRTLLAELRGCPAWVTGVRWDYLAWNRAAEVISGDLGSARGLERNALHQLFLSPRVRDRLVDWESHARGMVGILRQDYARWLEDPWFNELIRALDASSPEFRRWWRDREVRAYRDGVKHYDDPERGRLSFTYSSMSLSDEASPGLSLVTYIPLEGTGTRERLLG